MRILDVDFSLGALYPSNEEIVDKINQLKHISINQSIRFISGTMCQSKLEAHI